MYEIWLALNIAWEIAAGHAVLLALAAVAVLAPWVLALRAPGARWRATWPRALVAGAIAAVLAALLWPAATSSSLREVAYWVDAVSLAGLALLAGAIVAAAAWPLSAWLRRDRGAVPRPLAPGARVQER